MITYSSNRLHRLKIVVLGMLGLCLMMGVQIETHAASASSPDAPGAVGAFFNVTWSSTCETPPPEAETALAYAAGLWSGWISSTVPIEVSACWTPNLSGGDTLGTGMPTGYVRNFANAPLVDVQYPIALANALAGVDLNPVRGDMTLAFKSDVAWSFAVAGSGSGMDFIGVALHELGHGLGFIGNMYVDYSVGFCGDGIYGALYPCPTPYDWFAVDSTGTPLLEYKTPDPRDLGDRLKSDANFGGPNTLAANGASAAKLYTPGSFSFGSSLSHLDQTTFGGGENKLMTPSYSGMARHPGPVTLAIMQDIGWLRADDTLNVATSGPRVVGVKQTAMLTADLVGPDDVGQPVTYTWEVEDQTPVVHPGLTDGDSVTFTWTSAGEKRVTLTAADGPVSTYATRTALVFDVNAAGPSQGKTDRLYTFNANVVPGTGGYPITYTWEATDQVPVVHPDLLVTGDSVSLTWTKPGTKTVTATAAIAGYAVRAVQTIEIEGLLLNQHVFLPLVIR